MGKNIMLERGRFKIWLAGKGSAFPVGAAKHRTTIGELYLPRVLKTSQAIAQMPTRPSLSQIASVCENSMQKENP